MPRIIIFVLLLFRVEAELFLECDEEWTIHGSMCYWKKESYFNQTVSNEICQSMNASMAIIRDKETNDFVKDFIMEYSYYWLGAFRVKENMEEYKWIDGSDVTYSDLKVLSRPGGQPFMCVDFDKSGWRETACNMGSKTLCQKAARAKEEIPMKSDSECDCEKLTVLQTKTNEDELDKLRKMVYNQGIRIRRMRAELSQLTRNLVVVSKVRGVWKNPQSKMVEFVVL